MKNRLSVLWTEQIFLSLTVSDRQKNSPQPISLIQSVCQSVRTRVPLNPYRLQNPSFKAFLIYKCVSNEKSVLIKYICIIKKKPHWVGYLFAFVDDGVSGVSEGKSSIASFSFFLTLVKRNYHFNFFHIRKWEKKRFDSC